jgi:hypothetical protein
MEFWRKAAQTHFDLGNTRSGAERHASATHDNYTAASGCALEHYLTQATHATSSDGEQIEHRRLSTSKTDHRPNTNANTTTSQTSK